MKYIIKNEMVINPTDDNTTVDLAVTALFRQH